MPTTTTIPAPKIPKQYLFFSAHFLTALLFLLIDLDISKSSTLFYSEGLLIFVYLFVLVIFSFALEFCIQFSSRTKSKLLAFPLFAAMGYIVGLLKKMELMQRLSKMNLEDVPLDIPYSMYSNAYPCPDIFWVFNLSLQETIWGSLSYGIAIAIVSYFILDLRFKEDNFNKRFENYSHLMRDKHKNLIMPQNIQPAYFNKLVRYVLWIGLTLLVIVILLSLCLYFAGLDVFSGRSNASIYLYIGAACLFYLILILFRRNLSNAIVNIAVFPLFILAAYLAASFRETLIVNEIGARAYAVTSMYSFFHPCSTGHIEHAKMGVRVVFYKSFAFGIALAFLVNLISKMDKRWVKRLKIR